MDYQAELEETQRALREVILMIEQSQGELAKITAAKCGDHFTSSAITKTRRRSKILRCLTFYLDVQQRLL
jgi:hypothetical protein